MRRFVVASLMSSDAVVTAPAKLDAWKASSWRRPSRVTSRLAGMTPPHPIGALRIEQPVASTSRQSSAGNRRRMGGPPRAAWAVAGFSCKSLDAGGAAGRESAREDVRHMKLRLALASALVAAPVQAAVTLDAQTREIAFDSLRTRTELFCTSPQSCSVISQTNTPDADAEAAPGFDPFDAALSSSIFPSVSVTQE